MLAGIPVPEGVVITTAANETSLESSQLRDWLAALPAGVLLAVRSSGVEEDSVGGSFSGNYGNPAKVRAQGGAEGGPGRWGAAIPPGAVGLSAGPPPSP